MSTSIGQYGNAGAALILAAGIKEMTLSQQTLSWQQSAGTLSETYAGLGSTRASAISLTPKITQVQAWQSNVSSAQNNLSATSTALQQIVTQAQALATSLLSIGGTTTPTTVAAATTQAQDALTALATTLNTSNGVGYVFAGQASTEPPLKDPTSISSGTLATTIAGIVGSLGSSEDPASVMTKTTTAAADNTDSVSVFSASLSVSGSAATALQQSVLTGDNTATVIGTVATQGTSATSNSTGSPIRDLMRDMMIVSSMNGMSSSTNGFSDLVNQLHSSLESTISQLTDMETSVGVTQNALTSRSTLLSNMETMLKTALGSSRNVDIAEVATQSSNLSTSLKASYILVADMKDMTLASYI
ncbi:flagellin [Gluconacetobacter azotocaptans]|uniref:flagellin n=1 Tax=Gluconacetobacter azotocaptans TaxID=142834 RepID=UPI00195659CA|nr:flagellin [Gluconacetobacter azotocaptans]MBM9402640.1 flagellin [Gluconacetobacter azotocaptans]